MTVITTLITRHYTALASDSFITTTLPDGSLKILEDQESKLIRVPAWRGAMAYWGLATLETGWNTKHWLESQATQAGSCETAEKYALAIASSLTREFRRDEFRRLPGVRAGLGIHFSTYERVDDYWIPELFVITNWADESYARLMQTGFAVTRETYRRSPGLDICPLEDHAKPEQRKAVHAALQQHLLLMFNNGDPELFNPIGDAMFKTFLTLRRRGRLVESSSVKAHLSLARRPVEIVSSLLADFAHDFRVIGGKPHDLAVSPNGLYETSTGHRKRAQRRRK